MLNRQESKALEHQAIIVALLKLCDPHAMDNFKIGDTVQLKSGSPVMTVSTVFNDGRLQCSWFEGSTAKSATFHPAALRSAEPPTDNGTEVFVG